MFSGAELRTMKRLQGWSRYGSTFFLSVANQGDNVVSVRPFVF